ncbi:273_t:CDS:2 [Funneliformis geosporum]|uniref:5370_t:CDS:1 n=1 Tax=Funneliformis geosporum TaxID=1117311 RepID=A0A9W4SVC8_9GLOM|nr:273_t:CDS:2 [Funneliformis geosporum]CAI2182840.1 5370_t:CDS:2 [Funneliformis geosporum]
MEKQMPTTPQFTTLVGSQLPRLPTDHEKVLDTLENDFKRMDKMFASGEMRVFGRNSDSIFKELDLIRSKQISLAVEHISLENLPDKEMPLGSEIAEDSEENFKRNSERFAKKEDDLNNLMENLNNLMGKLEELGQSMTISEPKT